MCRNYIYVGNTTSGTSIASGDTYPLTQIISQCGNSITLNNNAISLNRAGCYEVDAEVCVVNGSTAGDITATLMLNGQAVTGATGTVYGTASNSVVVPISAVVMSGQKCGCCNPADVLTIQVVGTGVTSSNLSARVVKI